MKKTKKILFVTPYFLPNMGGVQSYVYNIAKGLNNKYNWDVVIITSGGKRINTKLDKYDGLKVYRLSYLFKISNTPINPMWYFQIKKIIKKEIPDLVNVHSPVPYIADITSMHVNKIPLVVTYHSGSMIKEISLFNPLIFLYESLLLQLLFMKSAKIICYSPDFIKLNLKRYITKVKYIPPGVDVKVFKSFKIKPTNDILFVGRIEKNSDWKGIRYLLDAISLIKTKRPDISLRLVGTGDRIDYFKKYSEILKINKNVTFVGLKTGMDLANEYQTSRVLVLPSITKSESFGIVLIEAMICKKPVVGTRIGGIPYVIDNNKNGLLVEPKNSKQLAKAIFRILSDKKLEKRLGENGYRKVINNYTWDKQIKKTHDLLAEII